MRCVPCVNNRDCLSRGQSLFKGKKDFVNSLSAKKEDYREESLFFS